ncbi:39S ribosomal protein L55, mitochondrial isoform X2 [Tachyglossus aculeatus]|uniref:39S ribosomal protein L55, mitochondrial isoform X2 n=1 Tax=Tachyglossus aculeatus TaxID=9261 RepID=UPI0018F4DCB0|nr:39S ribosomal protein L55, mitochondrial isoform X2 [Tachyglossus aculeatus]
MSTLCRTLRFLPRASAKRLLHGSPAPANSNRAALTRVHRAAYARCYPVLLVREDGSTIRIRYREPRHLLAMPVDMDTLSPEERKARLRRRNSRLAGKKDEEPEVLDHFQLDRYQKFWKKK